MRNNHDGHAVFPALLLQKRKNLLAGLIIKRAGRFVAQQKPRPFGQRPRDCHALLLAAGKLRRKILHTLTKADLTQNFVCRDGIFTKLTRDLHVFQRCHVGKQIIKLEHKADLMPAVGRQLPTVKPRHILARQQHMAARQPVHASENV